jgi:uncharacterized protein YlaI
VDDTTTTTKRNIFLKNNCIRRYLTGRVDKRTLEKYQNEARVVPNIDYKLTSQILE